MSITVTCSCGRKLKAPDTKAGKMGKCPACGTEVQIPKLAASPTESSILRILGVGQELRKSIDEYDASIALTSRGSSVPAQIDGLADLPKTAEQHNKKVCPQCDWEIDAGYKICPRCRYYFVK